MKTIVIGSPIRQKPEVLAEFLLSLRELVKPEGFTLAYFFIDDNEDLRSSKMLGSFAEEVEGVSVFTPPQKDSESVPALDAMGSHFWNERLVWKVAAYKNDIIRRALELPCDFLFFIDSDLVLHPGTLVQLLGAGKDIVSNIFWTRWRPESPEMPQVWLRDHYTLSEMGRNEPVTAEVLKMRQDRFLQRLREPGLYEVGGLGACTLLSRRVLERGVDFSEVRNISFWGEDRHFCIRAVVLGFSLFVDTHYPAYHIYRPENLAGVAAFRKKCGRDVPHAPAEPAREETPCAAPAEPKAPAPPASRIRIARGS